jgi:TolB-like protein/DNA-binding winged helix-turn-helix (wHTH) protein/cytochrome c-type biogenesis protein CcmH/NrfG
MRDPGSIDANSVPWNETKPLRFAGLVLDLDACTLARESGDAITLTRGELALLRVFVTRPGRVLSRDTLLNALGARRFEPFDRSVDMQVGRLRRKIEPDPKEPRLIVTVPGEGYRFDGLQKTFRTDPELPNTIPASQNDEPPAKQDPAKPVEEVKAPDHVGGLTPKPETPARPPTRALPHKGGGTAAEPSASNFRSRFALLAAGALVLLAVIAAGAWRYLAVNRPTTVASTLTEPARLSMVVLPFVNLSGDPAQDYIVDALTGELTTSMSHFPHSLVIGRGTAFTYKGKPVDAKAIGKELGVRYVLDGSVQPSGPQVRINAQLIDAESGLQVWADQFDATRADLLQTQNEIVARLGWALWTPLTAAEAARLKRKPPANFDAEDLALQCVAIRLKSGGPFGTKDEPGFPLCERALAIDPNNVLALNVLATKYWSPAINGRSADPEGDLKRGDELASKALTVDPNNAWAHHYKALILGFQGRSNEAIAEEELAISMDPSVVEANLSLGGFVRRLGQFERSLELIDKALRLSPRDPSVSYWYGAKADALFALKRYDEAIEWARRTITTDPNNPGVNGTLAAALALTGRDAEAQEVVQRLGSLPPHGLKTIAAYNAMKARFTHENPNPRYLELWDRKIEGLRKAGLTEE